MSPTDERVCKRTYGLVSIFHPGGAINNSNAGAEIWSFPIDHTSFAAKQRNGCGEGLQALQWTTITISVDERPNLAVLLHAFDELHRIYAQRLHRPAAMQRNLTSLADITSSSMIAVELKTVDQSSIQDI